MNILYNLHILKNIWILNINGWKYKINIRLHIKIKYLQKHQEWSELAINIQRHISLFKPQDFKELRR